MIIELTGSNETLLSQVERKGIQTNAQCRQGYCGACRRHRSFALLRGGVKPSGN